MEGTCSTSDSAISYPAVSYTHLMPPELAMQMPIIKDVLRAMNIEILELEGYEADDIIGTVAQEAEKAMIQPLIITGDKDALQPVSYTHLSLPKASGP